MRDTIDSDDEGSDESFPTSETFADGCGRRRTFKINLLETGTGYFLRATEDGPGDDGYAFAACAESSPHLALGRLRQRIREGLATRYLSAEEGRPSLTHQAAIGHIGFGGVVVDGRYLSFEEFGEILQTYEGFRFSMKIVDPYEVF